MSKMDVLLHERVMSLLWNQDFNGSSACIACQIDGWYKKISLLFIFPYLLSIKAFFISFQQVTISQDLKPSLENRLSTLAFL